MAFVIRHRMFAHAIGVQYDVHACERQVLRLRQHPAVNGRQLFDGQDDSRQFACVRRDDNKILLLQAACRNQFVFRAVCKIVKDKPAVGIRHGGRARLVVRSIAVDGDAFKRNARVQLLQMAGNGAFQGAAGLRKSLFVDHAPPVFLLSARVQPRGRPRHRLAVVRPRAERGIGFIILFNRRKPNQVSAIQREENR